MKETSLKIGTHTVKITHTEKLLFPDDGITKEEFLEYHRRIADIMVPHLKGRPTVLFRFHDNIREEGYYQQAIPDSAPAWIPRISVQKEGGSVTHIVCDNAAALVYIANLDCVTLHVWLSRRDKLAYPDQLIFDLDPSNDDFAIVRQGARYLKGLLEETGLTSFLKTTGSHGLHVVVPLRRKENFETVRGFAQKIAAVMVRREPEQFTAEQRKEKRQGRLFVDILRNAYGHTAVAPYAIRAYRGAPVAAPLFWQELDEPDLTARSYNMRNIFERLEKTGDPWKDIMRHTHLLSERLPILERMTKE